MKYTHTPTCMIISLFKLVFEHRAFRAGRCGCPRKGYMRTAQMLRIPRVLPRRRACARQIAPCRAVAEKEDAHQHAYTRVVVKVCLRIHPHHRACARAAVNCLGKGAFSALAEAEASLHCAQAPEHRLQRRRCRTGSAHCPRHRARRRGASAASVAEDTGLCAAVWVSAGERKVISGTKGHDLGSHFSKAASMRRCICGTLFLLQIDNMKSI